MVEFKFTEAEERWLAALESGDYGQCYGTLQRDGRYCAIGLWMRVNRAMMWGSAGVKSRGIDRLQHLNDIDCLPFAEIAAEVRAQPSEFFWKASI